MQPGNDAREVTALERALSWEGDEFEREAFLSAVRVDQSAVRPIGGWKVTAL